MADTKPMNLDDWLDAGFNAVFGIIEDPRIPEDIGEAEDMLDPHELKPFLLGWDCGITYMAMLQRAAERGSFWRRWSQL